MFSRKINADQICSIEIYRKLKYKDYFYREGKKSFWGNTKEGFYHYIGIAREEYISSEEIEKDQDIYVDGKSVYYRPHIDFKMSNGVTHTKFFKTESDLDDYLKQPELASIKFIH